jgi:hypothetical protein
VLTEAYSNTATRYEDTAQGFLVGRGAPRTRHLDFEVDLIIELRRGHRLRVASYRERAIDVPPPQEEP